MVVLLRTAHNLISTTSSRRRHCDTRNTADHSSQSQVFSFSGLILITSTTTACGMAEVTSPTSVTYTVRPKFTRPITAATNDPQARKLCMFDSRFFFAAALIAGSITSAHGQGVPAYNVAPTTFTAPFAHPTAATSFDHSPYGPSFRWGWFGAAHYAPVPQMHRTYNRSWKEWHTRR